jgi:hypothetical protein
VRNIVRVVAVDTACGMRKRREIVLKKAFIEVHLEYSGT